MLTCSAVLDFCQGLVQLHKCVWNNREFCLENLIMLQEQNVPAYEGKSVALPLLFVNNDFAQNKSLSKTYTE